jgi:hypothetical protein
MVRRFGVLAATGALFSAGLIAATTVPAAAVPLIPTTCNGNPGVTTYSPGIGTAPTQQTIRLKSKLTGCTGPLALGRTAASVAFPNLAAPDVKSKAGALGEPAFQPACNNIGTAYALGTLLAKGPAGSAQVTWSGGGGGTSLGKVKMTSTGTAGQATVVITITTAGTGPLAVGDTMTGTLTYGTPPPCPTITSLSFTEGVVNIA